MDEASGTIYTGLSNGALVKIVADGLVEVAKGKGILLKSL